MKLLVTGAKGQLGQELVRQARQFSEIRLGGVSRSELDIADRQSVQQTVSEFAPDVVINAAAYTAVDKAESEPEAAHKGNAIGPMNLAQVCAQQGVRLLHLSTDFVFDGESNVPYQPDAPTRPLSVYGQSKLDGERAVIQALPNMHGIVRTAWVYGPGGQNFVSTMLRLLSQREELSVVMDQIGCPTSTIGLAEGLLAMAMSKQHGAGIYHHSDAGVASWYDFACAIRELAAKHYPQQVWGRVKPIFAVDYPTPARRPKFSLLDSRGGFGLPGQKVHWREALERDFTSLVQAASLGF